jgi:hypothetical protein
LRCHSRKKSLIILFSVQSLDEDDNELFEPLKEEIKENQWLGVTVSSQKPNGSEGGLVSSYQS